MDYLSLFGIAVGLSMDAFCRIDYQWRCIEKSKFVNCTQDSSMFWYVSGSNASHWLVHRKNRRTTDTYGRPLDCSDSSMLSWNQNDLGFSKKRRSRFLRKKFPKNQNIACNGGSNQY